MKQLPLNFYSTPELVSITMTKDSLQELLLETDGWITVNGKCYDIEIKSLGAGVYKVWLERKLFPQD